MTSGVMRLVPWKSPTWAVMSLPDISDSQMRVSTMSPTAAFAPSRMSPTTAAVPSTAGLTVHPSANASTAR